MRNVYGYYVGSRPTHVVSPHCEVQSEFAARAAIQITYKLTTMYLIYDTETNKLGADACAVEVGAMLVDGAFNVLDTYETLVQLPPGAVLDPRATAVHGIEQRDLDTFGALPAQVFDRLAALASQAQWCVAYNNQFDLRVLGNLQPARHPFIAPPRPAPAQFCLMLAMTDICKIKGFKYKYKWPNLQQAHAHCFGVGFSAGHEALADVAASVRILKWYREHMGELSCNNEPVWAEVRLAVESSPASALAAPVSELAAAGASLAAGAQMGQGELGR